MSNIGLSGDEAYALSVAHTNKEIAGAGALKGQDGFSPVVEMSKVDGTTTLKITDKNGSHETKITDGTNGQDGADGFSPIVSLEKVNGVSNLTITDRNGAKTTNIADGFSPKITVDADNTDEVYKLDITTIDGTFKTDNLRGIRGEKGEQGDSAVSAINPRGDYTVDADPSYVQGDYVTYTDGNTYVCKLDNPTNEAPIDGTVDDAYWQVIALRGAKGEQGEQGVEGKQGTTFTPSVAEDGTLSWTNDGALENPEPIKIVGADGKGVEIWTGTKAEYEAVSDTIAEDTYVNITDDSDENIINDEEIVGNKTWSSAKIEEKFAVKKTLIEGVISGNSCTFDMSSVSDSPYVISFSGVIGGNKTLVFEGGLGIQNTSFELEISSKSSSLEVSYDTTTRIITVTATSGTLFYGAFITLQYYKDWLMN